VVVGQNFSSQEIRRFKKEFLLFKKIASPDQANSSHSYLRLALPSSPQEILNVFAKFRANKHRFTEASPSLFQATNHPGYSGSLGIAIFNHTCEENHENSYCIH